MEKTNVSIIYSSLLDAERLIPKGAFAHIEYEAEEKLPKYLNLGKVTKHVTGVVQMRYSYENAVNNRLEKAGNEATFEAKPLAWGKWLSYNLYIAHNNEVYLRYYTFNGGKLETTYFVDGREATGEEIQIIREYKESKSNTSKAQENAGLAENQVKPCALNIKNILSWDCGNFHYQRDTAKVDELKQAAEHATINAK